MQHRHRWTIGARLHRQGPRLAMATLTLTVALTLGACSGDAQRSDTPPGPAQTPVQDKPVYQVVERELQWQAGGVTIHGSVTEPQAPGNYAAVVLVAGSGPTDRDWKSPGLPGPNGSASLIAEQLAKRGVITLRYDKVHTGASEPPEGHKLSWAHYMAEIQGALELLAQQPRVDRRRLLLAGHSEGALHALRYLSSDTKRPLPSALILLASPGRSMREIIVYQVEDSLLNAGLPAEQVKQQSKKLDEALAKIVAKEKVDPKTVSPIPNLQILVSALANPTAGTFAREILGADPRAMAARLSRPVLLLQGRKDVQVDPKLDTEPLAQAAKKAGVDVTVGYLPLSDHVFKLEKTPRDQLNRNRVGARYNAPDRQLDPRLIEAMVTWLKQLPPQAK